MLKRKLNLEDESISSLFVQALKALQKQQASKKRNNRKLLNLFSVKVGYNDSKNNIQDNANLSSKIYDLTKKGKGKRKESINNNKKKEIHITTSEQTSDFYSNTFDENKDINGKLTPYISYHGTYLQIKTNKHKYPKKLN